MIKNIIAATSFLLCFGAAAQPVTMATMDGVCQPNSQFSRMTEADVAKKTQKHNIYKCNIALISEFANGRVVVNFSQKGADGGVVLGFSGTYANTGDPSSKLLEVDGMYFVGKGFDNEKRPAKGRCEIDYNRDKVASLACLSGTKLQGGDVIISSAIFKPSSYSVENIAAQNGSSSAPSKPVQAPAREPWYGVSAGGGKCVPTDMSPAERIEWLRERGVRYDAIDYAGPMVNGRVPKVTIIPRTGNYPNWVYYGSKSFCEEKETAIEKYR
jgi:hypothetical protein